MLEWCWTLRLKVRVKKELNEDLDEAGDRLCKGGSEGGVVVPC